MLTSTSKWIVLLGLLLGGRMMASDNDRLLDALIRKGVLSSKEAEEIRAEVDTAGQPASAGVRAAGAATDQLNLGMRMQVQYVRLDAENDRSPSPPPADHFLLRRMYLSLQAHLGPSWSALMVYDLASSGYDDAIIEWKPTTDLTFDFGLRKVNVGYEERSSSGDVRAIERSAATRYFVESNNGRRLGAASYRVGAFVDGTKGCLVYSAAITTPERNETFNLASSSGNATNNQFAVWAGLGFKVRYSDGNWIAGVGAGHLPDQGGFGVTELGRGFDLDLVSAYVHLKARRFGLLGEFFVASVEHGAASGDDAHPRGWFMQPTLMLTNSIEGVLRYAWIDSDHRGISLSDVIRSAPTGPAMNHLAEWYAGANWYLKGNDLKYQLGLVSAASREAVNGTAAAETKTIGVRSQLQLQF